MHKPSISITRCSLWATDFPSLIVEELLLAQGCQCFCVLKYSKHSVSSLPIYQWHACELAELSACTAKCMTTINNIYYLLLLFSYKLSDFCKIFYSVFRIFFRKVLFSLQSRVLNIFFLRSVINKVKSSQTVLIRLMIKLY